MKLGLPTILTLALLTGVAWADSSDVPTPPPTDSSTINTAAPPMTLEDSILVIFPDVDFDTLTAPQRTLIEFETRLHLRKREQEEAAAPKDRLSFYDSLLTHLIPPRWDQRAQLDRSFYHDAGDYFRADPSHFILEPQVTPMRKTVQPYGLSGDRLGFLIGGKELTPFDHVIEPDGQADLNDLPTALDNTVVILPGPVGLVFGGRSSAATLLTHPRGPDTATSVSTFLVDKGSFGYSYARGRYAGRFHNGREVDMSIGYRNADGPVYGRGDDAYHYTMRLKLPVGDRTAIQGNGWLYDRTGRYLVRPDLGGSSLKRDRFDRFGEISFLQHGSNYDHFTEIGYRHTRRASNFDEGYSNAEYRARYNLTGHGGFVSRDWLAGSLLMTAGLSADRIEYDDRVMNFDRYRADAELAVAKLGSTWRLAARARQQWVEDFKFLPTVSFMASRESDGGFLMVSGSYSERAPSLHELHLRYQEGSIYSPTYDYAEQGNASLKSERQLMASAEVEWGSVENAVGLSMTGGKITDGIDWTRTEIDGITVFSPANGDVDFITVTGDTRVSISDFLRFVGGASYHHLDYENFESKAYSPEYQAFSGLELHVYWPQKLIHFWGYGEIVYTGPYHGYVQTGLGEEPVINIKLSFKMGSFRFHWISQNVLSNPLYARDYYLLPGRFNSYGFTWDFID